MNEIGITPARLTRPRVGAMPTRALLLAGLANREAGLGGQRRVWRILRSPPQRCRRSTLPGLRVEIVRVEDLTAQRTQAPRAKRQFVHVRLEEDDGAGLTEPLE